jgi:multisubunit Na+/H+ antiporter MnhG subunit
MSPAGAKTAVFVSGGILVGLALLSRKPDTYRRVWAAGLWTTLVAAVADVAPELVGWFSVLVIVAAVAADQGLLGQFLAGNPAPATGTAAPTAKPNPTPNTARVGP